MFATFMSGMVAGALLNYSAPSDPHCAACAKLVHLCRCKEGPR